MKEDLKHTEQETHRLVGCVYGNECQECSPYHLPAVKLDPTQPFLGHGDRLCICGVSWRQHTEEQRRQRGM